MQKKQKRLTQNRKKEIAGDIKYYRIMGVEEHDIPAMLDLDDETYSLIVLENNLNSYRY